MKNWLDNVTNEQIKEFMKGIKKFDKIEISRSHDRIKVSLLQTSCDEEYEDRIIRYYFNEFGEGYIYRDRLILSPLSEETKKWFIMMYKANIDEEINGLSYCEAFEQAHKKALIDNKNLKNAILQNRVNKQKEINNTQLKNDLSILHSYIKDTHKNNSEIKSNLIVSSLLKHMSHNEKPEFLKTNGSITTSEISESISPLITK